MEWLSTLQEWLTINGNPVTVWLPTALYYLAVGWGATALFSNILWIILRQFGLYDPGFVRFAAWMPWRPVYLMWIKIREWYEAVFKFSKFATAKFASVPFMLAHLYKPGKILLGYPWAHGFKWPFPVGLEISKHIQFVGGTGSGKTTFFQTLVGLHIGSAFIIDPKYQILDTLKRARKRLGQVFQLTPLRPFSHSWNSLDDIKAAEQREGGGAVRMILGLAEFMIEKNPKETKFWPINERGFWSALVAFVYDTADRQHCNLVTAYDLLMHGLCPSEFDNPKDAFKFLLHKMQKSTALDGFVSKGAAAFASASEKTQGDILSGLRGSVQWLSLPEIRRISRHSDFLMADLKTNTTNPITVFLAAPVTELQGPLAPWFRLATTMCLKTFEHIEGNLKNPCLVLLDEKPSLGRIVIIETSAAVLRSFGVRLVGASQDLGMLEKAYPDSWESIIGNSDLVFWGATNHQGTIEYMCKILGETTIKETRESMGGRGRVTYRERPLIYADQLRRWLSTRNSNVLVTRMGERAFRLGMAPYYKELPVWKYDVDPNFTETRARAWSRKILLPWLGQAKTLATSQHPLPLSEAQALFGLTPPYSRNEIETRARLLQGRFNPALIVRAQKALQEAA